jgi:hypothetical protein
MNGKQAKRLRRQAEQETIGKRWDGLTVQNQYNDKGRAVSIRIEHSPQSGRGVYQTLKKEYLNGSR